MRWLLAFTCLVTACSERPPAEPSSPTRPPELQRNEPERAVPERAVPERAVPERAVPERAVPDRRDAPSPELVRGTRPIMSTQYQISVLTDDRDGAERAIDEALDEVERLGTLLSEWVPESEVSAINRAAGGAPVRVGPDTLANVQESLRVARWTNGAFDITWAAIREFYLFQPGQERVPDMDAVRARLPLVAWRDVEVDSGASTVRLRRAGMSMGLGGIAKGYAADRAAAVLRRHGFRSFLVFAGGQVLAGGSRGERPWRVGIQHPRQGDYIGFLEVSDASVATSGDYEHFFIAPDGTRWHHILDLSTGLPATACTSVTIVAPTGLLADGLDTGCFVMGPERCLAMLAELDRSGEAPGVEAVILDRDLRVWTTPGIRDRLVMRMPLERAPQ